MKNKKSHIILGIDPGTSVMGYGIISIKERKIQLISLGIVKLSKYEGHYKKLGHIYERVNYLAEQYKPDVCAIEAPFYGKNIQSMLKLGRAQGVAIAAVLNHNLPVFEYSPKKIKQSITGNGNASKEQVAAMLKSLVDYKPDPSYLDATDALAAAVCHHFQSDKPGISSKSQAKDWKSFIAQNPGRVK